MADATLQAQLDPTGNGTGIRILNRVDVGTLTNYYVVPTQGYAGHARWVSVTTANTDNQKETAIRAALA